jgi:hypothetical protein
MRTYEDLLHRTKMLAELNDGWYDGAGKAPERNSYAQFTAKLLQHYPSTWPAPALVPTPEGNLLLEWNGEGEPSVDIDLTAMHAMFQRSSKDGTDIESSFDLRDDDDWAKLIGFLGEQLSATRV